MLLKSTLAKEKRRKCSQNKVLQVYFFASGQVANVATDANLLVCERSVYLNTSEYFLPL